LLSTVYAVLCQVLHPSAVQGQLLRSGLSRFLAPNGRWYLGRVIKQAGDYATVQFEHPSEPYMLEHLQVQVSAVQPHHMQQNEPALSSLPPGSTVYARLAPHALFERSEIQSINPDTNTAHVTAVSSGSQHQVPLACIAQSITYDQDVQEVNDYSASEDGFGSDVDSLSDDMPWSDNDMDTERGVVSHGTVALAVLDADLAASKVRRAAVQSQAQVLRTWPAVSWSLY